MDTQHIDQQLLSAHILGQAIIAYNDKLKSQGVNEFINFKIEHNSNERLHRKGTRVVIHRIGGLTGDNIKEIMDFVDIVKGHFLLTNGGDISVTFPNFS